MFDTDTDTVRSRTGRRTAVDLAIAGLVLPLIGFAVADLLNPEWSPAEAMVSHYVHAPHGGWLIPLGLLVLAGASGTLIRLAAAYTRGCRTGLALLGVWAAGLLVAAVFPADPFGRWDQPPTTAGALHAIGGLLAFVALPTAAVLLSRAWRRDARWHPVAGGPAVMAVLSVVAFVLFAVTYVDLLGGPALAVGGWPTVAGLAERVMVWVYAGWLVVAAAGLRRR